jgi:FkbM family methyltransferase
MKRLSPRDLKPKRIVAAVRYRRFRRRLVGPRLLAAFARTYPNAFFIEVGANDGKEQDLLQRFVASTAWRGIMVEPVPWIFRELIRNYGGSERLVFESVAISDRDGGQPFYHPVEVSDPAAEGLPHWYKGLGSFSREEILSHADLIPDIERRIVCTLVPCLTLASLCRKHRVQRLDLLALDTEGHDWEILRGFNFAELHPRLVVFEHYHLSAAEQAECRAHLRQYGYEVLAEYFDSYCLDVTIDDRLTDLWRGLRPTVPPATVYDDRTRSLPPEIMRRGARTV